MPPTNSGEAVLHIFSRVTAIEQYVRHVATQDRLNTVQNELRRDFGAMLDKSEAHYKDLQAAADERADRRHADLQKYLEGIFESRIPLAVGVALDAEKKRQSEARQEIDNKAKDSVRGVRILMWSLGPISGGLLVLVVGAIWLKVKGLL